MNKLLSVLVITAMLLGVMVGCSDSKGIGNKYNDEYNDEKMITVSGKEVSIKDNEDVFLNKELGVGFVFPDSWKEVNREGINTTIGGINEIHIDYVPSKALEKISNFDFKNASVQDSKKVFEEINEQSLSLCIYRVHDVSSDETVPTDLLTSCNEIKDRFAKNVSLGKIGKDKYYMAYNTDIPLENLTSEDKEDLRVLIDGVKELKNNIIIFPVEEQTLSRNTKGNLQKFTATDINGETVTEEILKDYDLTMVNVWATWCGYCLEEMPELAELYKNLPKNVNMISIAADAADDLDLTKQILNKANAEFVTLVGNKELKDRLLNTVVTYPTTVFVDNKGNIVGSPQVGVPGSKGNYAQGYKKLIDNALSKIGK